MKAVKKSIYYIYYAFKFIFILLAFFAISSYFAFYYVLNHYFSKQEIKAIVTGQLQEIFSRPATVESVLFDAYGRIQIKGLAIHSRDNQKYFIICPRITGRFSPYSVLSGNLEIKSIKLISPEIFLRRDEDGSWRFEDILLKWKNREKKSSVKIDGIEIEDGKINIEDLKNKLYHTFEKIDFSADFNSDTPFSNFTISTEFKSGYIKTREAARFFLNADFKYGKTLSDCALENLSATLTLDDKIYSARGEIKNLASPDGALLLEIPSTNLKTLIALKDELYIPQSALKLKFSKNSENAAYSFRLLSDRLKASASGIIYPYEKNLPYNFSCNIKELPAEKIKLTLSPFINSPSGLLNLDIKAGRDRSGNKKWTISSYFSNMSFSDKENIFFFTETYGKIILDDSFKAINILGGKIRSGRHLFTGLNFKWESSSGRENMEGLAFFNGKKTRMRGMIKDNETPARQGDFSIYCARTDLDEIENLIMHIAEIKKKNQRKKKDEKYDFIRKKLNIFYHSNSFENIYGRSGRLYAQAQFSSFNPDLKELSGIFKIKAENGSFLNVQENAEKNNMYYLISLPITTIYRLNRAGSLRLNSNIKNVDFSQSAADYSLNNGKIVLNSFYIDGKEFMAYTRGDIDFTGEKLNLNVYVLNNKFYSMGGLPEALTDAKGRPAMAFKLNGKFRNNEIKILDPNNNPDIIKKAIDDGVGLQMNKFINSEGKWLK